MSKKNHRLPEFPHTLAAPRAMRLYEVDDIGLIALHQRVFPATGMDIVTLIRRAVHAGLPIITKELER